MEGGLLYPTDLNAHLKTTFTETENSLITFDQISEHRDPAKLAHKINIHVLFVLNYFALPLSVLVRRAM